MVMFSTMQDEPLSLATLLRYAATFQSAATVSTWTGEGMRTMTFGELGEQAARLANALHGLGVGVGDRVGTFMWNNNEHQVAYIGVPAMGAVLHPLNIRLPPGQLVYTAGHAEDQVVIVDGTLVPLFAKYLPSLPAVRHVIVVGGDPAALAAPPGVAVHGWDGLLAAHPAAYDFPVLDERSAAAICYTSGTTGDPKGVVYSHRSNWLHAMQVLTPLGMGLSDADSALAIVPMFHANAWGLPYAALMAGTSLIMPDRFLQPEPVLAIMAAVRPTFAAAVPAIWSGVLDQLERAPQDISHLRSVVVGGSAAPPSMMRAFQDRHGVGVLHAWGMTETSPLGSVAHPPAGAGAGSEREWAYRVTQGRFPAAVQARLTAEDGSVLPNDGKSLGELEVRGPWIAGSYYAPDGGVSADPEKFRGGWLRTGDVGTITPDGYLTIADRSKDMIKSGGEWISSAALENLVMAHPAVAEAAVIGVPDEKWDERPLVTVVVRAGASVTPDELRAFLAGQDGVARWQLPERWTFVSEVPKASTGKFDKKLLRARYADGELDVVTL
jgi:fatty-acyl-CoA synthase